MGTVSNAAPAAGTMPTRPTDAVGAKAAATAPANTNTPMITVIIRLVAPMSWSSTR